MAHALVRAGVLLRSSALKIPILKKKGSAPEPSSFFELFVPNFLDQSHVLSLQSLRSLLDFELHLRAFVQ